MERDWYGYWARIYEDPELYANHFGGGCYGDDDNDDEDEETEEWE